MGYRSIEIMTVTGLDKFSMIKNQILAHAGGINPAGLCAI